MILSKYNAYVEDYPFENGVTVFGLVNKAMAFLEDKLLLEKPDMIDEDTKKYMYMNRLLFFSKSEEQEYIEQMMRERYDTNEHLDITVVTSQNCNLQCVYCFEGKSHNIDMSDDVCTALLQSIDSSMQKNPQKKLYIHYYGGEPLMNPSVIRRMNTYLSAKYGDRFTFGLVTNGVLLNKELIDEWKSQGFSRIKITLDGNREFNDSRRIAKDGKSTYDRVMENIALLPEETDNILHLVVDQTNYLHIEDMLQDMVKRGYNKKLCVSISYTHPNYDVLPTERAALVLQVAQLVKKYNFPQSYLIGVEGEGICPHKDNNSYLVDVDGTKYKCTGFMGLKDSSEGWFVSHEDVFMNSDTECLNCKYLPCCNGGCQFIKALRGGKKYCQKGYFDALVPEILKVYIDYELSDD